MRLLYFSQALDRLDIRLCITILTVCLFALCDLIIGYIKYGKVKEVKNKEVIRRYE
jgi:hypothetical protein